MAAINNKYHCKIGDFGFLLARMARTDRHYYNRKEAPHFVNKFSSGEPNYRDSTFFPHWVQLTFLNGFDQEFFDDGGKFYRSNGVDTTNQLKLQLEKNFSSAGQALTAVNVTVQDSWRQTSGSSYFGDGSDGALVISTNATETVIDSACTGTLGSTSLTATNASFNAGQKVLIHQTQGTGAGTYQENTIASYTAGTITLQDALNANYTTGAQVRVMKQYTDFTVNAGVTYTCKSWNGTVGGLFGFYANGTITINGTISANGNAGGTSTGSPWIAAGGVGCGFAGGAGKGSDENPHTATQGESSAGDGAASTTANGSGGGGGYTAQAYSAGGGGAGHAAAGTAGTHDGESDTNVEGAAGASQGVAALTTLFMGAGGGGGAHVQVGSNAGGGAGGGIIFMAGVTFVNAGAITSNGGAGGSVGANSANGGGGAGGSILIKAQTATLGTGLITAAAGSATALGGAGAVGRIHLSYLTSYTGTTTPTADVAVDGDLTVSSVDPAAKQIIGTSDGKIYEWDGASTYTELFDTRRLEWFETGTDGDKIVGDVGGTETAQGQSFQVDAACQMKAVQVYLKKNAGTPGAITVQIETNSTDKPSGTLVNDSATTTIPAFTTETYGWVTVEFPAAFSLAATTTYWITLKTAAADNDQNYAWAADSSSPGYTGGTMAASTNGGSTWSAVTGSDAYFRVLGNATSVNCSVMSSLSGTSKMYFGVGNKDGTTNGDAKIYSYDGTDFVLVKIFNTTNESSVNCMYLFGITQKMYIGLGSEAKVYTTADFSTFTLTKTINVPGDPGWVLTMTEYNGKLYAGGGYPQQLTGNNYQYQGFLYSYDEYSWTKIGDFDHTVITALDAFDSLLFIGTIKKKVYVFNTASIDKLFEFPNDLQVTAIKKWDDKLVFATAPTPGTSVSGYEGMYVFDRNGFHLAFWVTARSWYSLSVFKNNLMAGNDDGYVYQTSSNTYISTGWLQTSYDEAQLPSIDKIRRSLTLMFESLPASTSISVDYKTDESDASWTNLGTASTEDDTEETFNFAAGVYSKKITFKITLTSSVASSTPVLKKIIHKYVLAPDFKYLWEMKLLCADNITWLDGEEPVAILETATAAGDTSITLKSSNDASPLGGFPDPNGSTMYCSIINPTTGVADRFTYTGLTTTTLTGIPSTGANALGVHTAGSIVRITGGDMHQKLLDLKEAKTLYTFTDIDGLTYTVLFHAFSEENFVINQDDYWGGLENEVPITLLEA